MLCAGMLSRRFFSGADSDTDSDLRISASTQTRLHSDSELTKYIILKGTLSSSLFAFFTIELHPDGCKSDAADPLVDVPTALAAGCAHLMLPLNVSGMTGFKWHR